MDTQLSIALIGATASNLFARETIAVVFSSVISRAKRFELRLSAITRAEVRDLFCSETIHPPPGLPLPEEGGRGGVASIIRRAIRSEVPPEYS